MNKKIIHQISSFLIVIGIVLSMENLATASTCSISMDCPDGGTVECSATNGTCSMSFRGVMCSDSGGTSYGNCH